MNFKDFLFYSLLAIVSIGVFSIMFFVLRHDNIKRQQWERICLPYSVEATFEQAGVEYVVCGNKEIRIVKKVE